ncbi:hypothetical protein DFH11DRAFT_1753947, partial [Phellopilus nigrolimitatus]
VLHRHGQPERAAGLLSSPIPAPAPALAPPARPVPNSPPRSHRPPAKHACLPSRESRSPASPTSPLPARASARKAKKSRAAPPSVSQRVRIPSQSSPRKPPLARAALAANRSHSQLRRLRVHIYALAYRNSAPSPSTLPAKPPPHIPVRGRRQANFPLLRKRVHVRVHATEKRPTQQGPTPHHRRRRHGQTLFYIGNEDVAHPPHRARPTSNYTVPSAASPSLTLPLCVPDPRARALFSSGHETNSISQIRLSCT